MERRHQEIAGAASPVACEDASGAVGTVCCGRESDDQHASMWIAESGDGASPVRVAEIGAPFLACDTLTVRAQARATLARDDVSVDGGQVCHLVHESHEFMFWVATLPASRGTWRGLQLVIRSTAPIAVRRQLRKEPKSVRHISPKDAADLDATETREWLDSLDYVLQSGGPVKVARLLRELTLYAKQNGVKLPFTANTPYVNTIPADEQALMPGNPDIERRIKSFVRWNAAAMVVRANKAEEGIGGHISTFASAATLYEVGFNHFFHGPGEDGGAGDVIYFQGHAAPGIYARAYLEGRIDDNHLENFRRELKPGGGLSSYPHPWLMPDFWDYPSVSMGLSPLMAIYQARFIRYLEDRGLKPKSDAKVWAFLGDGETDEPESLGAITLPAREKLDNLIFVINCNLQRLDGPVRGNGQIIQELEAAFRGAGWNVIKVLWGREWDPILAKDRDGLLVKRMGEIVDGQYQRYSIESGAYIREHFWGVDPRLLDMVKHLTDDQLKKMTLGGHDPIKVYNAYKAAVEHKGTPTVVLARTIKGYGLGEAGEGKNITHQQKKLNEDELKSVPYTNSGFRLRIPKSATRRSIVRLEDSVEANVHARTPASARRVRTCAKGAQCAACADLERAFRGVFQRHRRPQGVDDDGVRAAAGEADARQGHRTVRRADRARRIAHVRHGSAVPQVRHLLARRAAVRAGRLGHAPTSKAKPRRPDSRRGHHRGRLDVVVHRRGHRLRDARHQHDSVLHLLLDVRLPADRRSDLGRRRLADRGFMLGGTAGRTTLTGEGLQHQDGNSQPVQCLAYPTVLHDPAFAYETASSSSTACGGCTASGRRDLLLPTRDNENYEMPPMPEGVEDGIMTRTVQFRATSTPASEVARALFGSGAILPEVVKAQEILGTQVQRRGRRVERDELRPALSRWQCGRSLEHAASG